MGTKSCEGPKEMGTKSCEGPKEMGTKSCEGPKEMGTAHCPGVPPLRIFFRGGTRLMGRGPAGRHADGN